MNAVDVMAVETVESCPHCGCFGYCHTPSICEDAEQALRDQGAGAQAEERWDIEQATNHLASFGGVNFARFNEWVTLNPGGVCKLIEALLDRLPEPCRSAMVDSIAMDRNRIMRRAQEIADKRAALARCKGEK